MTLMLHKAEFRVSCHLIYICHFVGKKSRCNPFPLFLIICNVEIGNHDL